jgi:short subunit dehydrogenase-like uncharacterized protein
VAGRNADALALLARKLGLEQRVFPLDDPAAVSASLRGVSVVLHCAGPFARTSKPMADGCLRASVPYLDITGEVGVFEASTGSTKLTTMSPLINTNGSVTKATLAIFGFQHQETTPW